EKLGEQHKATLAERERAARAEGQVREGRWNAYLANLRKAQAARWSGQPGRRFDSLQALAAAAEAGRVLGMPAERTLELRNEDIACIALPDFRLAQEWDGCPPGTAGVVFDATLERYARSDTKGNISVRGVADDGELVRLPGPGQPAWSLRFSPNGRFLAAYYG